MADEPSLAAPATPKSSPVIIGAAQITQIYIALLSEGQISTGLGGILQRDQSGGGVGRSYLKFFNNALITIKISGVTDATAISNAATLTQSYIKLYVGVPGLAAKDQIFADLSQGIVDATPPLPVENVGTALLSFFYDALIKASTYI